MTYWLNVRTRRRNHVEDAFNEAIAAVAVADASKSYLRSVAKPPEMSSEDHLALLGEIAKSAVEIHVKRCAEAREALGRVLPYEPSIRRFYENAEAVTSQADTIIGALRASQSRFNRRGLP